ncbi:MAG: hypothetical protein ACLT39_07655, partial [Peptoniphilus sp.]
LPSLSPNSLLSHNKKQKIKTKSTSGGGFFFGKIKNSLISQYMLKSFYMEVFTWIPVDPGKYVCAYAIKKVL